MIPRLIQGLIDGKWGFPKELPWRIDKRRLSSRRRFCIYIIVATRLLLAVTDLRTHTSFLTTDLAASFSCTFCSHWEFSKVKAQINENAGRPANQKVNRILKECFTQPPIPLRINTWCQQLSYLEPVMVIPLVKLF